MARPIEAVKATPSPSVPTVDVHAHLAVPAVDALVADEPGLARQRAVDAATLGPESLAYNQRQIAELAPALTDLDLRLEAMDHARVDVQAVSAVPTPHAWADEQPARRIVALTNDGIAEFCARRPDRLVPVAAVALQHPDLAADQLHRAVRDQGMRAVQISTAAAPGVELDDPSLRGFWAAAE